MLRISRLRPSLALLALGLALAPGLRATTVVAPEFDSLVAQADFVVRAVVTHIESAWTDRPDAPGERRIITRVRLDVREVIKGEPPQPLVLEMLGGRVGDQELVVHGAPRFRVGDESILFLHAGGRYLSPLVALRHGHYPVQREAGTGRAIVLRASGRQLFRVDEVSLPLGAPSPEVARNPQARPLGAAEFAARIRQTVETQARARQN